MSYGEEAKKEAETVAPRTFTVNLSDADVKRLYKKAAEASLTPEELFENFVGDLVDGTYSNGSDERMCAEEWYNRCWFSFNYFGSFLAYLVRECEYEDFINSFETAEESAEELLEMNIDDFVNKESYDEEHDFFSLRLEDANKEIKEIFDGYCEYNKEHKEYDEELKPVLKYRDGLAAALSRENERNDE